MINKILEWFPEEEILKADGLDEAVIGLDVSSMRLIYSRKKCIKILCRDMSEEEANDFFEHNVESAYLGNKTPIWCLDDI